MHEPFVSILIPVYNTEKFLDDCLRSVQLQTLNDIEIICINDGSTDASRTILEKYTANDKRFIIVHKENTGYGNTMNVGLRKARGKYVGIVESDDFIEENMFEKLYEVAERENADIVKSNFWIFDEDKKTTIFNENLSGCLYERPFIPEKETKVFFSAPAIWSCLYRKSFLDEYDICFHETPGASYQDTSFAFKSLALSRRMYLLKEAFLYYRVNHPYSSTSSIHDPSKIFCVFDEFLAIRRFLMEQKNENLVTVYERMKFIRYIGIYNQLDAHFQYAFYLRMLDEFKQEQVTGWLREREWPEMEWENLKAFLDEPFQWFKKTVKVYRDERIYLFQKLNRKVYHDGLLQYLQKQTGVIVYGAGQIGKKVCEHFKQMQVPVHCFAVTSKENNPEDVLGLPVLSIDALSSYATEFPVVVAVKDRDQVDILKKLDLMCFQKIITIDVMLLKSL